jgi:hypothetical protein
MSIFDDPTFKKMKKSLSKKEQEEYDKAGEHMYSYDYNDKGENKVAQEVLQQLTLALKSGLHPSDLEKDEIEFLEKYHSLGKSWFKDFGYLENDLNRINF